LSGGLTPILVTYLMTFMRWREIFLLFGCLGFIWALLWFWWFRDEPRDHPSISPAERDMIERTRGLLKNSRKTVAVSSAPPEGQESSSTVWRRASAPFALVTGGHQGAWSDVFRTRSLLPLCLQYFANTYGFYFFITWLPTYLSRSRGMADVELATFAGMPLLLSVLADITGGLTTDSVSRRFGRRVGRCGVAAVAYFFAAVAMIGGTLTGDGRIAGFLIALGGAASMFTLAPAWATAIELGGTNSAVLSATMNTAGQVGGMLSPLVLAYMVDRFGSWNMPLHVLSCLYLMAAICWILIRPTQLRAEPQV
jgi:nitrate/nitrite transporter NarK